MIMGMSKHALETDEEMMIASATCLVTGFALCFLSYRRPLTVVSTVGGLLFGVFCINELVPQLGDDGILCTMAAVWVSFIGALVGGTIALLVTWASVGTCLGCLAGAFLVLLDGGVMIDTQTSVAVLFGALIAVGLAASWWQENRSTIVMTAAAGALLITLGTDLVLNTGLTDAVGRILQMRWKGAVHCRGGCPVPALLLEWAAVTVLGVAFQCNMSDTISCMGILQRCGLSRGRNAYTRVPGQSSSSSGERAGAGTEGGGVERPAFIGTGPVAAALEGAIARGKVEYLRGDRRTFTYPENEHTWNYFDPNDLPYGMAVHKKLMYDMGDILANALGFQDDNVRNQVEHVLILLVNHQRYANEKPAMSLSGAPESPKSAYQSLHRKLFHNYRDWCESMRVAPAFSPIPLPTHGYDGSDKAEVVALATDLMLWLCIWGEAANIRHMPECLCFLYHKMMQDYLTMNNTRNIAYGGYFLDHVVTPIFEVLTRRRKGDADHSMKLNYDDFNEFFWTPSCLMYSYRGRDITGDGEAAEEGEVRAPPSLASPDRPSVIPIAAALEHAPKTFVEKRSILSTVLCFRRVLEFNVLAFQMSAVIAFGTLMVWDRPYFLQMASSVFWTVNFLGIVWTGIEVWQAFPGINMTGSAKCGFLVRLSMRFLILYYQSLYFMWSTQHIEHKDRVGMQAQGSFVFWWWQYLWLSIFAMIPYAFELFQQIFPPLATWICLYDSDYLQALLNICYPLSRVYVGKRVDESVGTAKTYIFFWVSLLAWKLWFSYNYEVVILVLPSVELYDDYVNYPNTSYWGMFFLILLRWIPQMFIYLIDTSIWFACWSAMAGSVVGFQERLGEVRDFPSIRGYFMKIPEVLCAKVLSPDFGPGNLSIPNLNAAGNAAAAAAAGAGGIDAREMGMGTTVDPSECSHLLANTQPIPARRAPREAPASAAPNGERQGDNCTTAAQLQTKKWKAFAAVWNKIINQMRQGDVISNAEQGILKFHKFEKAFEEKTYLPIFQTAGCVELAVDMIQEHATLFDAEEDLGKKMQHEIALRAAIKRDVTVAEALSEAWELGVWFLVRLLGPTHLEDAQNTIQVMNRFIFVGVNAMDHLDLRNVRAIVEDVAAMVTALHHALPKRPKSSTGGDGSKGSPDQTPTLSRGVSGKPQATSKKKKGTMTKSISTSGLSMMATAGCETRPGASGGVSSGLATEGRRQGMVGGHTRSEAGPPDKTRDAVRDKLRSLYFNMNKMLKTTDAQATAMAGRLSFMSNAEDGFMWKDKYATKCLDAVAEDTVAMSILEKLHGLLCIDRTDAEPHSVEARRRLAFFANSLFMDMPRAPAIADMMSWSCMTPFYSEDVLYSRDDLDQKNEDGLTTLMYLQALYKHDWRNYMERKGFTSEKAAMSKKNITATRMWASLRAQTLARTVEGIMYYEAALRFLAQLEDIAYDKHEDLIKQKFQYVVACQVYGRMKKNQDPKADDIELLLKRFPYLRVAYIDEVRVSRSNNSTGVQYFSVLIKATSDEDKARAVPGGGGPGASTGGVQEVYRVMLPGNPVFGEGKPENQNHAAIFTRGEHLQAIDMNQEGYFEEALKMRCLLEEFRKGTARRPTVIVGFREHIFTGSVSSLANYMALQELSFGTLGQRVLNNPLKVRMHYGHPDLFDKVFFMTAGGISKASKGINLSEDIFAGYNGTSRGGKVQFKEYAQVGKGRDVGMQQIYKFEAKLSQGAAEQTLSRDVNRLGDRLDFFRLMSFYFGGLGYYVGNFVTVLTITFVVYFVMALAVFNVESIGDRKLIPEGNLQMMLAGMGLLNTMPMLATLTVEKGLLVALGEVIQVFVSGGPMYFMFHIQTRAHYFYQTLLAGGAQYRATGRGFVTHHSKFDDLYRFFANSHFYLGFELMMALIVTAGMTTSKQYLGMTWSLWLACLSFLFAPFWFNPLSFHWGKVVQDYKIWMRWMTCTGGNSSTSWEVWWREENSYLLRFTIPQKMQLLVRPLVFVVIGYGIGGPQLMGLDHSEVKVVVKLTGLAIALLMASIFTQRFGSSFSPWFRRSATILITTFTVVYGVYLLLAHTKYTRAAVGLYYVCAALSSAGLVMGLRFARYTWHIHDFVIGHMLFLVLILLAALQFPSTIQTWLLFHNALSEGVVIDDILKYARTNKELEGDENLDADGATLRAIVAAQGAAINALQTELLRRQAGGALTQTGDHELSSRGAMANQQGAGYSYVIQPLGGLDRSDSTDSLAPSRAEMMYTSNSTLALADLDRPRGSGRNRQQGHQEGGVFEFSSPNAMPPR